MKHNVLSKILALVLVCVMAVGTAPAAFASDAELTRAEAAEMLVAAGDDYGAAREPVLQGGREDEAVTRIEVLAMLQRAFGELPAPKGDSARWAVDASAFDDVPNWAKTQLKNVLDAGVAAPNAEGNLGPKDTVSRQELENLLSHVYALEGTNLKDDFYANVNKEWLESTQIPAGRAMTGTLYEIMDATDVQLDKLIKDIVASNPAAGSPEQKIKTLYENFLNWDARNEAGITPIQPYLDKIDGAEDLDALMEVSNQLLPETGVGLLYFAPTQSVEDSTKKVLVFGAMGASLTKEFYAMEDVEMEFSMYVDTLFQLGGASWEEAAAMTETYVAMDKALAESRMSQEEQADISKIFNTMTAKELAELFPNVDLDAVLAAQGLHGEDRYVVTDVGLLEKSAEYMAEEHLEELKLYLRLYILSHYGEALNREFTEAAEAYNAALMGVEGTLSDEEQASNAVQLNLRDYLGQVYVKRYFSDEAKADVEDMIQEMLEV